MKVLFEDNHLIAVEKRSGQSVQPEPGKPVSLEEEVKQYIKNKYQKPGDVFLGVIHRLDMPVSGVVLFARTSKALERMNKLFHDREVHKWYIANVHGAPDDETGLITHYLKRDEKRNFTKAFINEAPGTQKAQLEYEVLMHKKNSTILKIKLLTGRKHQIRAQLAALGCPIIGDTKYGSDKSLPEHAIRLQSAELSFIHPVTGEAIVLAAGPPSWLTN
ncbi:MAG: RluA family pseudouridine synthase [Bacteroidia bacterium]|nr:RluA family pseudouridine synthase [Bacteroidia bacterium]